MESENYQILHARLKCQNQDDDSNTRRHCGCIRTSEKLKQILKSFPSPPPPTPVSPFTSVVTSTNPLENNCISAYCTNSYCVPAPSSPPVIVPESTDATVFVKKTDGTKPWRLVAELIQLVQLSVTATALALYYLIYCYMQLVYYTLRSALYFHNADGPMKITIGVVTVTSLIVGFNLLVRMEKLIGFFY